MKNVEIVKIEEICSFICSGGTPQSTNSDFYDGEIPWLNTNEVNFNKIYSTSRYITENGLHNSSAKYVPINAVVVAMYGVTAGKCAIAKIPLTTNQACCNLIIDPQKADYRYVYQYLKMQHRVLNSLATGGAQQNLNSLDIKRFKMPLPNINIQSKIADILMAYDDLIEANNHRIERLEQTAQELYKEWFVRFRFPGYEKVKLENGLPEGWQIKRIGDIFDITSSKRVYLADYVDDGVPFYRSKEIIQLSQGQVITEPLYISNEAFRNFKNKFGAPEKNDILITSVGTIGVSYLVDGHDFYFKDGNLTWIKSSSDKMFSLYLFQWLNSQGGKQQLLQSTIGTSQSALTIENLKKIKLLVPTKEIVEDYFNKTQAMLEQKRTLQVNNQNLAAQRDMLLPRLMSGKLEV